MNRLKQVTNKDDFAKLLGFKNSRYINYVLYCIGTDKLYKEFEIPKRMEEYGLFVLPNQS